MTLFDFGVAEDGSFYYVMELLDGVDTDALIRRFGPIPAERVLYVLRQMCHSLSEAESCGLVHRDIKPANIFLCRYGEDHDFVKVLDFGIAKVAARNVVGGANGHHDTQCDSGHARVHRAGASIGRRGRGHPRRHLLDRLRGLLAPDRAARVHGRHRR